MKPKVAEIQTEAEGRYARMLEEFMDFNDLMVDGVKGLGIPGVGGLGVEVV